jgi:hypothetical protein
MSDFSLWQLVLILVVLYFFVRPLVAGYKKGRSGEDSSHSERKPVSQRGESAFRWPSRDEYEFDIVGESHHQMVLSRLAGDHGTESARAEHEAILVADDNNPHDEKAVAVFMSGELVGHLSRDDARSFRRRLSQKGFSGQATSCGALVVGGWVDRSGQKMHYGVKLDIKPFV